MKFKANPREGICQTLERVIHDHKEDTISLGSLVRTMHERGFALLMMILVLPNCVPIPIPPGMSTVFSIPLLFLAIQMLWGSKGLWLPENLKQKRISKSILAKAVGIATPRLHKIERIMKPRLHALASPSSEQLVGFMWLLFSISIAVPLPMTNFLPGVGILISALGLLGRDGLIMLLGFVIGLMGCGLTTAILVLGVGAVRAILGI
ncbi:MAG: exopolysaccharide biosynthesis protein [Alphaproteobacteria bacterium]